MGKRIVIDTTSWFPGCRAAKKILQSKSLPDEAIDIEKNRKLPGS